MASKKAEIKGYGGSRLIIDESVQEIIANRNATSRPQKEKKKQAPRMRAVSKRKG